MAEPSGGAERDAEGYGGSGVGSGSGTSGAASGGFGTTVSAPSESALNPYAGFTNTALPGFYDLTKLDEQTIHDMLMSGEIVGVTKGTPYGYGQEQAGWAALADKAITMGLKSLMGTAVPGGGQVLGALTGGARAAASGMRGLGATGSAQGFKGGTGEPGSEPAPTPGATPGQAAFTQNVLPPSGNPLLHMAPAAQQARPGWLNPYLAGYSSPQPASPATNQGLPSGQLGPLYA